MALIITDTGSVLNDGRDVGPVFDVALERTIPAGDLLSALLESFATIKTSADAQQEAAQAEITKAAKLRASCEQALAAGDLDTLKALLQPAVDEAKQTEKERKLADLQKQLAEIQRQIDETSRAEAIEAVRP